jgi:PAT family beta-lactamase induction signal transducer AmpG
MALGMMLPGMFAGWLQEELAELSAKFMPQDLPGMLAGWLPEGVNGYELFFVWVMICSVVPIIAVSLLKIDPAYGRKKVTKKSIKQK